MLIYIFFYEYFSLSLSLFIYILAEKPGSAQDKNNLLNHNLFKKKKRNIL